MAGLVLGRCGVRSPGPTDGPGPNGTGDSVRLASPEPANGEPRPDELTRLADLVGRFLEGLGDRERRVLVLTLQGRSPAEVRRDLVCTRRTVFRILVGIGRKFLREPAGAGIR